MRFLAFGDISTARVYEANHLACAQCGLLIDDAWRYLCRNDGVAFVRRGCGVADGNADEGVGTAIVEEPFALVPDETLREDCAGSVLAALLEVCNGTEEGFVEPVEELKGIVPAEEHLSGCISARGVTWVAAAATCVLAVVDEHYAVFGDDCRRTTFCEGAVEVSFTGPCQIEEFFVGIYDGGPCDEVVACCATYPRLAPVHEVLAFAVYHYLCCLQASVFDFCDDGTRLAGKVGKLAVVCCAEAWAVVCPRLEVAACGYTQACCLTVPRCVYHDEEWLAVHFCLHHSRVFYAARPLVLLRDGRLVGVHDGRWRAIVHAQTILAFHQAYS